MPDNIPQQPVGAPAPEVPPAPQPPMASDPYGRPPKKNMGLLVGIIVGVVLLFAGAATALIISLSNSNDNDKKTDNDTSEQRDNDKQTDSDDDAKLRAANAKTASYSGDFSIVCDVGSVTNAAEFTKPYRVVALSKSSESRSWSTVSLAYDATYTVKSDEVEKVNVVACVQEQKDAAIKTKTCDFKSGDEAVSIDYYATTYDVTLYEAKSGQKIKELGKVGAPASTCPMFATYNKSDPKLIARPDSAAIDALIEKFVAK